MFKLMSYVQVPFRTSNAIDSLEVDLLKQKARCVFNNGKGYEYGNVSKRAIANVLFNPDVSLGFWVNNNRSTPSPVIAHQGTCSPINYHYAICY